MNDFLTTRWSLIARATTPGSDVALGELCESYWPPLFAYALRRGFAVEDARDVTQDFFANVLEGQWFERADAERGRFRTFLLTLMQRHIDQHLRATNAQKRGGGCRLFSLDDASAREEAAAVARAGCELNPDEAFDLRWAMTVLDRAMDRLAKEAREADKEARFLAMRPFLAAEGRGADYEQLAREVGMNRNAFSQAVVRLRERYRWAVREEIADTVSDDFRVDDEMESLMEILRRAV